MNKSSFISALGRKLNISEDKASKINDVLESHFLVGTKNKEKIINDLITKLDYSSKEAENIYETFMDILCHEVKEKLKHPFKDLD